MPKDLSEISFLILATTILVFLMTSFIVVMIFSQRRRQLKHRKALAEARREFEDAVMLTRLEIQEQTLNNISREIHDNVGQVLSFVKLSLNTNLHFDDPDKQQTIVEAKNLLSRAIDDLRDLASSFSLNQIKTHGLAGIMINESARINRSIPDSVDLMIEGDPYDLGHKNELLLFRIFQEALNNALKYSGTSSIKVFLGYHIDSFTLKVSDNGKGFDFPASNKLGSGLTNIQIRAALMGANATIKSIPENGCTIEVNLPRNITQNYEHYQSSTY